MGKGHTEMHFLRKFADDETGASAIEYGLIVALIAVGLITGLATIGNGISNILAIPVDVYVENSTDA